MGTFEYTEQDFKDLIVSLGPFHEELTGLIQYHMEQGSFKFDVKEGGSQGAASFIEELQKFFPDVYQALFKISFDQLPLYLGEMHESAIASWRLEIHR